MPRCPCSCGTFLNTSRSQTTPSAKSSNQTQCPADLSPKAKSRSWEVFWVPDAPPPGKPLLSDTVPPQGLHPLCSCFRLCAESLKTWTPEGMPHLQQTEGGLTASFPRVLI
ncbi:unnamed protein product [Rangifer tarandus platyrhynchus]|uniref:Uncharacterized protein n=1 Tax=Rangifer tarandus platyrhynchus TaxID=3082113 RepID=A0ACB1KFJ0_RANTA